MSKPLTEEYYYKARPRKNHKKESWQSFCRSCWKAVNAQNKLRRKDAGNQVLSSVEEGIRVPLLQQYSESIMCVVPKDFVLHAPEPAQDKERVS